MKDNNNKNIISRRSFLKFTGVAIGTAGTGLLTGCGEADVNLVPPAQSEPSSNLPSTWDDSADYIYVGFGGAAAMAAIHTSKTYPNAKILIIEQHTAGGGSTKICGAGTYLGGGTATQTANGFSENADDFYKNAVATAGEGGDADILRTYSDNVKATFDALVEAGVQYQGFNPGYFSSPPNGTSLIFDNERRPEILSAAGLTTPVPHVHFALADTTTTLTRAATMWRSLENKVLALSNVKISYSTEAKSLLTDNTGRVVGITATKDGATKNFKATRAVLLCCGGFINNDEMVKQFIPHAMSCMRGGSGRDKGAGIKMAQAIGADVKLMNAAEDFCPIFMDDPALVRAIAVTPSGDRFAAEDLGGPEMGRLIARQYPDSYIVFDSQTYNEIPEATRTKLQLKTGATIEALASELGIVPQYLAQTVARYNASASGGLDQQFKKGADVLRALNVGPFYAYKRTRSRVFTLSCGGLRINTKTQVLRPDGSVIKGLYAAGATTAHINAQHYLAGGGTSGAFSFGRIAGLEMAKENSWA
ncbi:FAD-binding protein [Seleniivibrio woodruffii]|uniref:FAD-binding protein n=1 Tax=Seleniivibrio woodruffii TaxID=1078050 RepID=UPI0039E6EC9E